MQVLGECLWNGTEWAASKKSQRDFSLFCSPCPCLLGRDAGQGAPQIKLLEGGGDLQTLLHTGWPGLSVVLFIHLAGALLGARHCAVGQKDKPRRWLGEKDTNHNEVCYTCIKTAGSAQRKVWGQQLLTTATVHCIYKLWENNIKGLENYNLAWSSLNNVYIILFCRIYTLSDSSSF